MNNEEIRLEIHEPFDAYQILIGHIMRPIRCQEDRKVYHLFRSNNEQWMVLSARYQGDEIRSVYRGQKVVVNIAAIKDASVIESNFFRHDQVHYYGVGIIEIHSSESSDNY